MQIHDFSQLQRFYHDSSEDQLRKQAEKRRAAAESWAPHKKSWETDVLSLNVSLKAASKGPRCLTPSSSWKLGTIAANAPAPAVQLADLSIPSTTSESELGDVGPRAWASVSMQTLPPLLDVAGLLPPSPPCAPWVGTADQLLGGTCPAPVNMHSDAAAYHSATQQLAFNCGQMMTYAAVAQQHSAGEEQQVQQQEVAPSSPVIIDPSWNYMFICLEAAARLGKRATYAMAAAGQSSI